MPHIHRADLIDLMNEKVLPNQRLGLPPNRVSRCCRPGYVVSLCLLGSPCHPGRLMRLPLLGRAFWSAARRDM